MRFLFTTQYAKRPSCGYFFASYFFFCGKYHSFFFPFFFFISNQIGRTKFSRRHSIICFMDIIEQNREDDNSMLDIGIIKSK